MTVVSICSIKGAPGVTTLACLIGATWPVHRSVLVAEADASGGDLAARFSLSSRRGWATLSASIRRDGVGSPIAEHLQQLPGGLDVLIAARPVDVRAATSPEGTTVRSVGQDQAEPCDVIVDLGRVGTGRPTPGAWLEHSDTVVVVTRADAASALQLREQSAALVGACSGAVGLAVIGVGGHRARQLSAFTGIPLTCEIPHDPIAAAVASGSDPRVRRLQRSVLLLASSRLASGLQQVASGGDAGRGSAPGVGASGLRSPRSTPMGLRLRSRREDRRKEHRRDRGRPTPEQAVR
jgi:hypothetical protein